MSTKHPCTQKAFLPQCTQSVQHPGHGARVMGGSHCNNVGHHVQSEIPTSISVIPEWTSYPLHHLGFSDVTNAPQPVRLAW